MPHQTAAIGNAIGHPIPVLIVDHDHEDLGGLVRALHEAGPPGSPRYTVWSFSEPSDLLGGLPETGPAVIFYGVDATSEPHMEWLERFVTLEVGPVIVMARDGDADLGAEALERGAGDFMVKSRVLRHPASLHRIIRQVLTSYDGEQPARSFGRNYLWLLGEVSEQSRRAGEILTGIQELLATMHSEVRQPLELAQQYPTMLSDRMGEPPTAAQSTYTDGMRSACDAVARRISALTGEDAEPDPAQAGAELRVLLSNTAVEAEQPEAEEAPAPKQRARKKAIRKPARTTKTETPKTATPAGPAKAAPAIIAPTSPKLRLSTTSGERDQVQLTDVPGLVWGDALQSYVKRLAQQSEQPSELALIQFTLLDPTGSLDAMGDFLRSTGSPQDLWLNQDDGRSLLAIRPTNMPAIDTGEWIRRVQSAWWSSVLRGATDGTSAFDATCIGLSPWPLPDQVIASLADAPAIELRKAA